MSQHGTAEKPDKNNDSGQSAAPGAAVGAEIPPDDPDLMDLFRKLAGLWSDVPAAARPAIKADILAVVRAASPK